MALEALLSRGDLADGLREAIREAVARRDREFETLRAEKALAEGLLDAQRDTVFVFDLQTGQAVRWNQAFRAISGYSDEEIRARRAPDSWYDQDDLRRASEAMKALASKGTATVELSLITKDQCRVAFEYLASRIEGPDGRTLVVAVGRDMTAHRRAEETLRQHAHDLGERIKELSCLFDLSRVIEASVSLPELLQGAVALIPRAWQYPEIAAARIRLGGDRFETDGFTTTAWMQSSPISAHGEVVGSVDVCYLEERPPSDEGPFLEEERALLEALAERLGRVIERRRAEAAWYEREVRWRSLAESSPDHILLLDRELKVEFANRASPGMTVDQIIGTPLCAYLEPSRAQEVKGILDRVLATREPAAYETDYARPDGGVIHYESRAVPRIVAGEVVGLTLSARDITERRRLEAILRERDKMAAMASLVAAVAHEVRNPLFALSATADLLAARFSGVKDLDRHLVALRGQVERLDELIRTLLEYGQAFVPDLREGRLAPVIERAVEACRALASEREVDLRLRLSATLPLVRLEQGRLVQVFENVVRNALQHSPKGGTVSIEAAETEDEAGRWISCAVRDSGDGFDEQEIPKVFEPFYTQTRGATGMGLTIAWRIVQDHRGTIAVANAPAGGAVVTVRLPAGLPGTTGSGR